MGRKGLALFDIALPLVSDSDAMRASYEADVAAIRGLVRTQDVMELKELPDCSDKADLSIMKLYVL